MKQEKRRHPFHICRCGGQQRLVGSCEHNQLFPQKESQKSHYGADGKGKRQALAENIVCFVQLALSFVKRVYIGAAYRDQHGQGDNDHAEWEYNVDCSQCDFSNALPDNNAVQNSIKCLNDHTDDGRNDVLDKLFVDGFQICVLNIHTILAFH